MIRSLLRPTCLLAAVAVLGSCAEQRRPIDRVQANALSKTFFVGDLDDESDDPEFFWRNFVVDASESEELIGIGSSSGLDRVRWHITENMLFARKSYSVNGGDPRGTEEENTGTIVAAYPIESHFDIRRQYNPSTGEELNVIIEDTADRPWYEREFFRVDWSINEVNTPNWGTLFYGQIFGELDIRPVSYYESDPNSEDAPYFDPDDGYFDVTSHFIVAPTTVDFFFFKLPTCVLAGFFSGTALHSCDEQEAVIRSSYWRVDDADPNDDYEPFENTEAPRDIFGNPGGIGSSGSVGILTPAREHYDPGYGYTDSGITRYMNRHNIWQQSHQMPATECNYDARRDSDGNGTDDQCENSDTEYDGSEGSQCSARGRCTIPYRDREIKPIAYYMNAEMPDGLQDETDEDGEFVELGASEEILYSWNQALQLAIARAREVECRRTGGGRDDCHAEFFETSDGRDVTQMVEFGSWGIPTPSDDTDVLVSCHNPVRSYDPSVCGEEGDSARLGDLRKHFLIYWPYATRAPYSGIGNWRGDPLTGQILGASATTVEAGPARGAAETRDVIMVANGELTLEEITNGVPAVQYEGQLRDGRDPQALTEEEMQKRIAQIDFDHLRESVGLGAPTVTVDTAPTLLEYFDAKRQSVAGPGAAASEFLAYDSLVDKLRGTEFEAQLIDPSWLVDAAGLSPNTALTEAVIDQVSPLRGMDSAREEMLFQTLQQNLGHHGVCFMDQLASVGSPDVQGVARYFLDKYADLSEEERADAIYQELWRESYKGIQLHEIGHSLGLLHNFTSSYDSVNFNPQYWQLRTHEGQSTQSCQGTPRTGDLRTVENDTCMGPRYLDPETRDELGRDEESRPGIQYFGHTSAMEYQNTRFFESVGLGQYDVMSMGALYGKVLETYDADASDGVPVAEHGRYLWLLWSQLIEDTLVYFQNEVGEDVQPMHYTELARRLKLFDPDRCRDATDAEKAVGKWRIVHGKICSPPPKDHAAWDDFVNDGSFGRYAFNGSKAVVSEDAAHSAGSVRWPYRFGGDLVNSYPHVNPWDSGADIYEITTEAVRRNDYTYPFTYFRRERREWTSQRLPSYTSRLLYERLRSYHWGIAVDNVRLPDVLPEGDFEIASQSDDWLRPALMAQREMFDGIARAFLTPEIGTYSVERNGVFDIDRTRPGLFTLDATQARFLAPDYDSSASRGGSWDWSTFLIHGGYRVEKSSAARALTDGRSVFYSLSRASFLDDRNLYVNFRSDMPRALDRLLGGLLAEDWQTVAPYITSTELPDLKILDLASDDVDLPANAQQIFPNIGYNQQVATILWAHLFGRISGDLGLSNKLRIWIDGLVGELDIPEEIQIRFTDPETGITYIGRRYGEERLVGMDVDQGIASRMLRRANSLLVAAYQVQTQDVDGEEVPVLDEFGRPTILRDSDGNALRIDDSTTANVTFRNYVGLLDASVQIAALVGHGPFNFF